VWAKLLSAFIQPVLQWLWDIWKESEAEEARWRAQALEQQKKSLQEGIETQNQWAKDAKIEVPPPCSGAGWNARIKGLYFLLSLYILASGCHRYVYVEAYRPVPPLITPPVLEDGSAFSPREQVLVEYAQALERAYARVRADAIRHNRSNGFPEELVP